jgi:hypothetical protein
VKLHTLRHSPTPDSHGHMTVTGALDVNGHQLPFKHKMHVSANPEELRTRLEEHHEKALHWDTLRPRFNEWKGKEKHGDAEIHVRFAQVGAYGPNDWRATVIWDETINGRTEHRTRVWHSDHPASLPTLEKVKEAIKADVLSRATTHAAASPHLAAFRALAHEMRGQK